MSPWLDEALHDKLDAAAATALRAWCSQTTISYSLVRPLTGGRSGALVLAVLEQDPVEGDRQLILKLDRAAGEPGEPRPGEFAHQRDAVSAAPEFAGRHLTRPVHQPISVGDGRWFVFQQVAADSLREPITLHTLLDAVLHPPRVSPGAPGGRAPGPRFAARVNAAPGLPPGQASAVAFAQAGGAVVRSVLADWAGPPRLERLAVPVILRRQLGHRLAPGGALWRLAAEHPGPTIAVDDEEHLLPNPFALLLDGDAGAGAGIRLPTFVGRAHGDLHVENILIPRTLRDVGGSYQLIDLARYAGDAVLTRDPTHLVLHVLARTLGDLSAPQRSATIDLLLQADAYDDALVPRWLSLFVGEVRSAAEGWARGSGLVDQWRDQMPLSLLACALMCLARPSTRPEDRGWFLRLAANASAYFLSQHAPAATQAHIPSQSPAPAPAPVPVPVPAPAPGTNPAPARTTGPAPAPALAPSSAEVSTRVPTAGAARTLRARTLGSSPPAPGPLPAEVGFTDADVLISHVAADQTWVDWITWHLEAAGWQVDARDEAPQLTAAQSTAAQSTAAWLSPPRQPRRRTLIVLSPAYLAALPAADRDEPAWSARPGCAAVLVRVEPCEPPERLAGIESVDLVGLGEPDALTALAAWARRAGSGDPAP
ncbi:TIR domain-containing protein [Frankia canadensis]|nr:TIR domain-containing protein [Frankia canadensis]